MTLTAYKQQLKSYGLHPTIWRKLRRVIGGSCDLELYGRDGTMIGIGMLSRSNSIVDLPHTLPFNTVSWIATIQNCKPQPDGEAMFLGPSAIPIGKSHY